MSREVREALERLKPALGPSASTLWAAYLASDAEARRELEAQLLTLDLARNKTGPGQGPPPLPPPEPGVLDGWLRLGEVVYPNSPPSPFGLDRGEMIQHVGIFGRSGAGKTNTVVCLLRELLAKDIPFLVFDWKRNYRDLLAAPWVPEGKVRAVTVGRDLAPLRLNPLRPPPGTDPRTWLKKLIEITAHAYFLGEGVMYLLQESIDACYARAGVYEGATTFPTFRDVHRELAARKTTGREANWMASALRTTASLTYGPMGDTICAPDAAGVGALLEGNVILELDALTDADKVFIVEAILLSVHHQRLAEGGRESLKHVLLVEEAHHVFLRAKQEATGGEPITDVILREIRELGEAVVLVDQHPSQMAVTALGNTYCTIAMNLKHRSDVRTIADACLLDPAQEAHMGRLPVGAAVVKLQDRWVSPFLVRFPKVDIRKGAVSDDILRLLTLAPQERRPDPPGLVPIEQIPLPIEALARVPAISASPRKPREVLGGPARLLLADVVSEPSSSVTQRYARLGLSRRAGTTLKEKLVSAGLVREVHVALPGGRITLLEPTLVGLEASGARPPPARAGGLLHRYWVSALADSLRRQGYEVSVEEELEGGRAIDLVARRTGEVVALELEVSGRRLEESIEKLKDFEATRRVLACADRAMLDRARNVVGYGGTSRSIEVCHVWSFTARKARASFAPTRKPGSRANTTSGCPGAGPESGVSVGACSSGILAPAEGRPEPGLLFADSPESDQVTNVVLEGHDGVDEEIDGRDGRQ